MTGRRTAEVNTEAYQVVQWTQNTWAVVDMEEFKHGGIISRNEGDALILEATTENIDQLKRMADKMNTRYAKALLTVVGTENTVELGEDEMHMLNRITAGTSRHVDTVVEALRKAVADAKDPMAIRALEDAEKAGKDMVSNTVIINGLVRKIYTEGVAGGHIKP